MHSRFQVVPAAACALFLAAGGVSAQSDRSGPDPELVAEVSRPGGEYLLGLGASFGPHRVLGQGSVLGFHPLGFNLGLGFGDDALHAVGLYRQHSPGRLPYLEVSDRQGGLLLLEYTPRGLDLPLTLNNQWYVGEVDLRHSGRRLALYSQATVAQDLLAGDDNRITLVADLSTLQLLRRRGGSYGIRLAAPMQFLDRTLIVEPHLLHSGLTRDSAALAHDLIGYRFGDFSVRRLFGLLEGVRSDTRGTTALVLNLEYRLHFLRSAGVPILDGLYVGAFADGGLFREEDRRPAAAGDFTVGGALGIDWKSTSLALEAGYNHADRGFVWGVGFRSFKQEEN